MADISTWSPTDESNTAAPPAGWPEGQSASSVNNCARAMMGAVRRWYDTVTAQLASITTSLGNYLPLSGGTVTGNLTVNGTMNAGSTIAVFGHTFAEYSGGGGGTIVIREAGGGAALSLQASNSYYDNDIHQFRNNAFTPSFTVNSVGNGSFAGNISGWDITAGGTVTAQYVNASSTVTGGYIHSTGNVQADGTFTGGAVSVSGAVTGNYVHSTGSIDAGTYVYAPDGFWAHDAAGGTTYRMYSSGGASYLQFANLYAFQWSAASGALNYIASGDIQWVMRTGDFLTYNALAPVGGLGAYINLSDRRGKSDIVPSTRGLDEILRLSPVEFQRVSRVSGQTGMDRRELGFIAQDVQSVLPEAVRAVGMTLPDGTGGLEDTEPTLGLADATIVAVLVNAVKELNARLIAVEGGTVHV